MNTPGNATHESPTPNGGPSPARHGYGAALMDAVRPSSKPFVGYGGDPAAKRDPNRQARGMASLAGVHTASAPATRPPPMPKRPKGRFLIASFLIGIGLLGATTLFNATLRFEAYGVVSGAVVDVSPPWSGVVTSIHVREGDEVQQGQLLANVDNLELQRQHAKLGDEIRIEQAAMEAAVADIRLETQLRTDQQLRVQADYWELYSTFLFEQYELVVLTDRRVRLEALVKIDRTPITAAELRASRAKETGQRDKLDKLCQAVQELKRRADEFPLDREYDRDRLRPHQRRLEQLQSQLNQSRELLRRGEIRAPDSGRILKVRRFAGEFTPEGESAFEILVDGSLGATLYVPQGDSAWYQPGKVLDVAIVPNRQLTRCEVVRIGDQLEPPPKNLEPYYRKDQRLLPVTMRPVRGNSEPEILKLGAEVGLPTQWWPWLARDR